MQLNVHVPRDRERLLRRLEAAARRLGRPKNQVVLDALERYLGDEDDRRDHAVGNLAVPVFHMGAIPPFRRADLYADEGTA